MILLNKPLPVHYSTSTLAYAVLYIIPCCYFFVCFHPAGPLVDKAAVFQLRPIYQHAARWGAGPQLGTPWCCGEWGRQTQSAFLTFSSSSRSPTLPPLTPSTSASLRLPPPPSDDRFIWCLPSVSLCFSPLLSVSPQQAPLVSLRQVLLRFSPLFAPGPSNSRSVP